MVFGRVTLDVDEVEVDALVPLLNPFGNGFFDLAFDCAANQPAKSGSPPSSKGAGDADEFV